MFFHTAGLHFPYRNMHYILVAGGNAFYEKVSTRRQDFAQADAPETTALAYSEPASPSPLANAPAAPPEAAPVADPAPAGADPVPDAQGLY